MAEAPREDIEQLPEPRHPFAKWGSGFFVGLWAWGSTLTPHPWNQLAALFSPGAGYLIGQLLDLVASRVSEHFSNASYDKRMIWLRKQLKIASDSGADSESMKAINDAIHHHENKLYRNIKNQDN